MSTDSSPEKSFSRRELLRRGVAGAALIASGGVVGGLIGNALTKESTPPAEEPFVYNPYGKFYDFSELAVSEIPTLYTTEFTDNVVLRGSPTFMSKKQEAYDMRIEIKGKDIRAKYVAEVFGEDSHDGEYVEGGYSLGENEDTISLRVNHNNLAYGGGQWFVLVNEKGGFVKPDGYAVLVGETPFYLAGSFVNKNTIHTVGKAKPQG